MTQLGWTVRRLGAATCTLMLALSACSLTGASHPKRALMPPDQAVTKMNALLDDLMSGIKPPLRYWDDWPRADEQTSGLTDRSKGFATASRERHVMTKVASAKYGFLMDMVERSWKAKGYRITSVNPNQLTMYASTADGSSVDMTIGAAGNITFGVGVSPIPVIRDHDPFGTPTPVPTMSNGNPDVIPKYDDPFWSN
ncbi:hypothetical protein ABT095_05295 [Kitasatospora sp. NPDC002227]|uniref:hypothetical protein n=1 Tax=Kitasatospora sp. NPDC002227 TaxID=3154773 RepID=UPI00332FE06F